VRGMGWRLGVGSCEYNGLVSGYIGQEEEIWKFGMIWMDDYG